MPLDTIETANATNTPKYTITETAQTINCCPGVGKNITPNIHFKMTQMTRSVAKTVNATSITRMRLALLNLRSVA
jgi:hypothetical protein